MNGPEQNTQDADGSQPDEWENRSEGGVVQEAMRLNQQRPDQNPVNQLNTSPGVPAPAPTPYMSEQAQQPGRQNGVRQDTEETMKAKSYASPMIAFVEGFLGTQNDQLEKVKEPKPSTEEEEAKRIAEQKQKLEQEESVDEEAENEEVRQALEEQRAEEQEQEEDVD